MATAQAVSIERRSGSPTPSPHVSPRSSPRLSPRRLSPRKTTRDRVSALRAVITESSTSTTPYYHSLKEGHFLAQLLAELIMKDSELDNLLRANEAEHHVSKVFSQQFGRKDQKQGLIDTYRGFLDSVVSLIAHSVFLENPGLLTEQRDPHRMVESICRKKCPELSIFRRVVTEPSLVASSKPDSISSDKLGGVPVNQLARFCDVAVLRFLSRVNENTKPQAVLWAVEYMSDLLHSLTSSIAGHASSGWYGAPSTRQKKTVSVNHPPPHFQAPPPTVVVVGSPPPPLDPETGQSRIQSRAPSSSVAAPGLASPFQFPPQFLDESPRLSPQSARGSGNSLLELTSHHHSESGDSSGSGGGDRRLSPSDLAVSPTWSNTSSPMLSPQDPRRGGEGVMWSEVGGAGGAGIRPRSPRLAELKLTQPQSIPEEEEEEDTERGSPPSQREGEGEGEEEVRAKPTASSLQQTVPDLDVKAELSRFVNAEGRISLVAILQAIARLPQSDDMWTRQFGMQCFQLIQHCMDLGLTQTAKSNESSSSSSSSQKRRRYQKQENTAFFGRNSGGSSKELPCQQYSKVIVHYAVHALVQCATNLLVGCSHDIHQTCWLSYKRVGTQNNLIHPRLLRQLNRIHCHSPGEFQRAMVHVASSAPLHRLLHFLHVVLEYCQPVSPDNIDPLLLSIVASILRTLVDRLGQMDLSKPSLQEVHIYTYYSI